MSLKGVPLYAAAVDPYDGEPVYKAAQFLPDAERGNRAPTVTPLAATAPNPPAVAEQPQAGVDA